MVLCFYFLKNHQGHQELEIQSSQRHFNPAGPADDSGADDPNDKMLVRALYGKNQKYTHGVAYSHLMVTADRPSQTLQLSNDLEPSGNAEYLDQKTPFKCRCTSLATDWSEKKDTVVGQTPNETNGLLIGCQEEEGAISSPNFPLLSEIV